MIIYFISVKWSNQVHAFLNIYNMQKTERNFRNIYCEIYSVHYTSDCLNTLDRKTVIDHFVRNHLFRIEETIHKFANQPVIFKNSKSATTSNDICTKSFLAIDKSVK